MARWFPRFISVFTKWLLVFGLTGALRAEVDFEITPLGEGMWLHVAGHETETWGRVTSNGLIVDEGEHVVVIDTPWGAENSRALLAWIEREIGKPVERLFVGHFHDDRLGGWEVFAERGRGSSRWRKPWRSPALRTVICRPLRCCG